MGADSPARRIVKRLLYPVLSDDSYAYAQALAKAWDIRFGDYPEPERDLIPLLVHRGDTVLDVGANYGYYSYPLSRAVGPTGLVYAFEPIAFTYRTLRIVAKLLRFRSVQIVPKGCSDRAGSITFEVPTQANGALSAGLAYVGGRNEDRPGRETQVRWTGTRRVEAEMIRLDDFLPTLRDLSFIKADIEGSEVFAFRGGQQTIERHLPTVLCEINPWYLEGFGLTVGDLASLFFERGYGLYRYQKERLTPTTVPEVVEGNYFFVHPSRASRLRSILPD
jgi:FkbM family methyltransferase